MRAFSVKTSLLKLGLLNVLLLLLGSGCKKRSWQRIPNDKLEQILTELYSARGIGQALYLNSDQQDSIYVSILQAHGMSQEDLDSTIYYLSTSKAKLLQKIIAQSSASIQRKVDMLEHTTGFFRVGSEDSENNFYSPLPDTLSYPVTPLSTYPIYISSRQSSYIWKVALADLPHLPDTIHQIEIQGLISGSHIPEQGRVPCIALSKQLDAKTPPLAMGSVSTRLPIGGVFVLALGESAPESTAEPSEPEEPTIPTGSLLSGLTDSLANSLPESAPKKEHKYTIPHFSTKDTLTIAIYSLPTDYLDTQSLYSRLHDLHIIAR